MVLFLVGYEAKPYIVALDGTPPAKIECAVGNKTRARVCFDGAGAVLGASLKNGRPDYEAIYIDLKSRRATTIASLACGHTSFQAPKK